MHTADAAEPLASLRAADFDRYLQVLLARPADRPALLALFHFNLELARVADQVREPMAGLIRLQWWRDGLDALAQGAPARHPALSLLAATQLVDRFGAEALKSLVDARERELDATPMANAAAVEAHATATAGALNALVARLVPDTPAGAEQSATDVGTAYGLLGIVRALPYVLGRDQPLLPDEPMRAAGTSAEALRGAGERDALMPVVEQLAARAEARLDGVPRRQPRRLAAAFVPAVIARQDLRRLSRCGFDVFDGRLSERPPWTTARCLVARATGVFA